MKESEIKEFFRLYFKIDKLADKIFDEFEKAKLLSPSIYSPRYKGIEFDECDANLVIRYEDSHDDWFDTIKIPFSVIYDNKVLEYVEKLKEETFRFMDLSKFPTRQLLAALKRTRERYFYDGETPKSKDWIKVE